MTARSDAQPRLSSTALTVLASVANGRPLAPMQGLDRVLAGLRTKGLLGPDNAPTPAGWHRLQGRVPSATAPCAETRPAATQPADRGASSCQ